MRFHVPLKVMIAPPGFTEEARVCIFYRPIGFADGTILLS